MFPSTIYVSIVIIIPLKTPSEIIIVTSYEIAVGQEIFLEKQMYPKESRSID